MLEDLRSVLNLLEPGRGAQMEVDVPAGIELGLDSGAQNQAFLNLSLNVIQRGGRLWLDSDYAGGASFCIELPRPTEDDSLRLQALSSEVTASET